MMKARLYEAELRKRQSEQQKLEDSKADIGWGHQIRSYVLDDARIKDLRTGVERRIDVGNARGGQVELPWRAGDCRGEGGIRLLELGHGGSSSAAVSVPGDEAQATSTK